MSEYIICECGEWVFGTSEKHRKYLMKVHEKSKYHKKKMDIIEKSKEGVKNETTNSEEQRVSTEKNL